jgi:hypothetical protein
LKAGAQILVSINHKRFNQEARRPDLLKKNIGLIKASIRHELIHKIQGRRSGSEGYKVRTLHGDAPTTYKKLGNRMSDRHELMAYASDLVNDLKNKGHNDLSIKNYIRGYILDNPLNILPVELVQDLKQDNTKLHHFANYALKALEDEPH